MAPRALLLLLGGACSFLHQNIQLIFGQMANYLALCVNVVGGLVFFPNHWANLWFGKLGVTPFGARG